MSNPTAKIPIEQIPAFLRWAEARYATEGRADNGDEAEMVHLIMELASVLADHPDNRLGRLTLKIIGFDDLTDVDVAMSYAEWCATGHPVVPVVAS